jgi:hypothetical protein
MGLSQAALELLVTLKDEASSGLSSLGSGLGTLGTIAGGAALAGVVALGSAIVGGTQDALAARELYASTQQTIETMGNAAGRSADDVVNLASSLSDAAGMSLFGDDQIQQSENLLLTFGNIKGEIFDTATALTTDLAQALGGAPADQAMMLGKALNDPIKGISALGKAGLTFSEEQKAAIQAMVESGDVAGAQAVIIAELNKQVGGQAAAAAKAAGGMVQFKAGLGETFETIGAELLPILDELGAWLASPEVQAAIQTFATNLANGIRIAAQWISGTLIPAVRDLYNWLAPILGPILAEIGRALSEDLPRGIERVQTGWTNLKQALADFKTNYIDPIVRGWNAIISAITTAYDWFVKIGNAVSSIQIPSWLQGHSPPPLANWFNDIASSAESAGGAVQDVAPPSGSVPSLPTLTTAGGGSGGGNVYITVQGSVTTERDLVRAVRDGMNALGRQNTSIFSPDVTP